MCGNNHSELFFDELWCCVYEVYRKIIWFYQLSWWCKLNTAKNFFKLTFRALILRQSKRWRANAPNVSFRNSLHWLIYIINWVDDTKLALFYHSQLGHSLFLRVDTKYMKFSSFCCVINPVLFGCCIYISCPFETGSRELLFMLSTRCKITFVTIMFLLLLLLMKKEN